MHLAEFTVDAHGVLAIRQLSSVLLKQYVEAHWSQHSEKFRPPETSELVGSNLYSLECMKMFNDLRVLPVHLVSMSN